MENTRDFPLAGDCIDGGSFSSMELRHNFHLSAAELKELVDEGLIEPRAGGEGQWRFEVSSLRRMHHALRLNRDLGVNWAGAALALELLDELKRLRALLGNHDEPE